VSGPSGAAARLGSKGSTLESKIRALKINKNVFKRETPISEELHISGGNAMIPVTAECMTFPINHANRV
jgi:hypothetical protein